MALFNFGKKKEEKTVCGCGCGCSANQPKPQLKNEDECRIKMLGAGCKSCHELYVNTVEVAEKFGIHTEVAYITDMQKVMEYGVMSMPALVIDEKVISQGKILKISEIEKIIGGLKQI